MNNTNGLVQSLNAEETTKLIEAQSVPDASDIPTEMLMKDNLCRHIEKKWIDAREAKKPIEEAMIKDILQCKGEYDATKLAEIRSAEQPEIFLNITDTKCRNAVAWVKDTVFQPGKRIFGVDHTPIPDLPTQVTEKIQAEILQKHINAAVISAQQSGQPPSGDMIRQSIIQQSDEIKENVKQEILRISKILSDELATKIDDDFTEGNYYEALSESIDDIIRLKAGIIKGPIFRKVKQLRVEPDQNGKLIKRVVEKIVPQYERRSPFSIFPSPRSTGVNNGYLFDVIIMRPNDLYNLIGVEGYNEKEIRNVLKEFNGGTLKNDWLGLSDETKIGLGEDKKDNPTTSYPEENIYCLELHDDIPGNLLIEWGLKGIEDEDAEYSCCVWKIGDHVIKAMLNYDVIGRKPFTKTSFQNVNDSFWGQSLPEKITDAQIVCNACARSILSNLGIGAIPMGSLNIDLLEAGASRKIWPGRMFPVTNEQSTAGTKPVEFFQPVMVTEKLMNVYFAFSKIADEHSGVPAYAHGDSQVGGAGNTASGLNMLITQAARGIKAVIRNIDSYIIEPDLQLHYSYLLDNQDIHGLIGDYKMVAKGTSYLLELEQRATRKIEYINNTSNPIDIQIVGMQNRRKMLFSVAKDLGINLDENILSDPQPQGPPGQSQPTAPATLDQAGNPAQGVEVREPLPSGPKGQQQIPIRAMGEGGDPLPGEKVLANESGEEGFVGPDGKLQIIKGGPQIIQSETGGTIIPSDKLPNPSIWYPADRYKSQSEWFDSERKSGYDMPAYVADHGYPIKQYEKGEHLTDQYKLPHHMTFSSGSKYSTPEIKGGEWVQDGVNPKVWHFFASDYNLTQHSRGELSDYFRKKEPNSILHLPAPKEDTPLSVKAVEQVKRASDFAGDTVKKGVNYLFGNPKVETAPAKEIDKVFQDPEFIKFYNSHPELGMDTKIQMYKDGLHKYYEVKND